MHNLFSDVPFNTSHNVKWPWSVRTNVRTQATACLSPMLYIICIYTQHLYITVGYHTSNITYRRWRQLPFYYLSSCFHLMCLHNQWSKTHFLCLLIPPPCTQYLITFYYFPFEERKHYPCSYMALTSLLSIFKEGHQRFPKFDFWN